MLEKSLKGIQVGGQRYNLVQFFKCTQEQYDCLKESGQISPGAFYFITDDKDESLRFGEKTIVMTDEDEKKKKEFTLLLGDENG